jgi:hypothetical protein
MKKLLLSTSMAALLVACGGGGGSDGDAVAAATNTGASSASAPTADGFITTVLNIVRSSAEDTSPRSLEGINATTPENTRPVPLS